MADDAFLDELVEQELTRRRLLELGALAGAGAALAGGLAGPAFGGGGGTPKRGGRITWALEQDPVHIAPFGAILTSNHWGKEFMYDSLLEWDRNLNIRPALAEKYSVVNKTTVDFTLKRGIKFHNGKEFTAADAKYSFELQANPPAPGSIATLNQFPKIANTQVRSKYVLRINLSQPDPSSSATSPGAATRRWSRRACTSSSTPPGRASAPGRSDS